MKVGEVYTYYSNNVIKIIKIYYDNYIKFHRLKLSSDNRTIYVYLNEFSGMEPLRNNENLKRAPKKVWYKLIRRLNEKR